MKRDGKQTRGFRITAKKLFLTYPRFTLGKRRVDEFIRGLQPAPKQWLIAEEKHEDGTPHIHAVLVYGTKVNIRSERHFDIDGHHGNYKACRNLNASISYCQKEDETPISHGLSQNRDYITQARGGDYKGALDTFVELHPKDYVLHKTTVETNLKAMGTVATIPKFKMVDFKPVDTSGWAMDKQALLLWGPSGTGKTALASAMVGKGYLLVRHIDQLKSITTETTGLIFDDMSFAHWPRESCIHLLDMEHDSGINVKHGHVVIPNGMMRIFTHNFNRDIVFPSDEAKAIDRRLFCLQIKTVLF